MKKIYDCAAILKKKCQMIQTLPYRWERIKVEWWNINENYGQSKRDKNFDRVAIHA